MLEMRKPKHPNQTEALQMQNCGLEYNRDLNGAVNIGNRLLGYMLNSSGSCEPPITSPVYSTSRGDVLAFFSMQGRKPHAIARG